MPSRHQRGSRTTRPGATQRQLRAGELVRRNLVEVLARVDFRDPELAGATITIGEVRASPDLKRMTVFVSALGQRDPQRIATALTTKAGFLRGWLARVIEWRQTPELHFVADTSYDEAGHIAEVLNRPEVRRDLKREGDAE